MSQICGISIFYYMTSQSRRSLRIV